MSAASPAAALEIRHLGTTGTGKTFSSPARPAGDYFYDTFDFKVEKSGLYDVHLVALEPDKDLFLYLYAGGFDAVNPNQNLVDYDDDTGGNYNSLLQRDLSTGVQYTAVLTSYNPGADKTSRYLLGINGAVPEPSTWAMMIVGFALVGASLRYRRGTTKVRFAH